RPIPPARLAARRHGRSHPGLGPAPLRHHGGRRDLPHDPHLPILRGFGHRHDRDPGHFHPDPVDLLHHRYGGYRHQTGLGLFHHQPTGLHGHGTGRRRTGLRHYVRRLLPPHHPRRLQGPALPVFRGLHSSLRHQRVFHHGQPRGAEAADSHDLYHHCRPGPVGHPSPGRLLQQGTGDDRPVPTA